jgi:hypothetical protein
MTSNELTGASNNASAMKIKLSNPSPNPSLE